MRQIGQCQRDQRCHVWFCDGPCCTDGGRLQCPRQYPIAWRGLLLRRPDVEGSDGSRKQSRQARKGNTSRDERARRGLTLDDSEVGELAPTRMKYSFLTFLLLLASCTSSQNAIATLEATATASSMTVPTSAAATTVPPTATQV